MMMTKKQMKNEGVKFGLYTEWDGNSDFDYFRTEQDAVAYFNRQCKNNDFYKTAYVFEILENPTIYDDDVDHCGYDKWDGYINMYESKKRIVCEKEVNG